MSRKKLVLWICGFSVAACGREPPQPPRGRCSDAACESPIRINELMAKNDGAWIDAVGEADDWIELINTGDPGDAAVELLGYALSDSAGMPHFLPNYRLEPGEVQLFWADDDPEQGLNHLPFKLSSKGETIGLWSATEGLTDSVTYESMGPNHTLARFPDGTGAMTDCRWASPGTVNGLACQASGTTELPPAEEFAPFDWPDPWPAIPSPVSLNELALRPASFIEVRNESNAAVDLTELTLSVAAHAAGIPWPTAAGGVILPWPTASLAAGELIEVPLGAAAVADIDATAEFEGVVTLWRLGQVVDRVDFMAWPDGAVLARAPTGEMRFCATATPAANNDVCDPIVSRTITDRLRHLRTPTDFEALASGGVALGIGAVKVVIDMHAGDVVHLLSSAAWDLHFTFVREVIDNETPLDRCDPAQNSLFYAGWGQFSREQYFSLDRRYLLTTLVHHMGPDIRTVEFATGDHITPAMIEQAFFAAVGHVPDPQAWSLRPQSGTQSSKMRDIEGRVPIVDSNAPFRGVNVQLLTEGVAFGVLTFVPAGDLELAALGPQVVVLTDQVPNDIPLVGGLITEELQTPLSHVNVLSRNRGTPNLAVRNGRVNPKVAPFIDTLVRLEVLPDSFEIRAATAVEAQAFWDQLDNHGAPLEPRLDTTERGLQTLAGRDISNIPRIGAKAAQLAELAQVWSSRSACPGAVNTPRRPAAIPLVHSLEHYAASGAEQMLADFTAEPLFATDPRHRATRLATVRQAIVDYPVDATLLAEVESYVAAKFGSVPVRFRSSSNTEDLAGFSGAGLYNSVSAALGDPDRTVADAIRTVWASLYNARAYDERMYYNVDQGKVAMGVLIHQAFRSERANGVAVSRNILNPIRSDHYYLNAQKGEASVTNPAAGITTEQLIYRWYRTPRIVYSLYSNLPDAIPVLSSSEVAQTTCVLRAIHDHFEPLLDPADENPWFAMDVEFKLVGDSRDLLFKQARPYSFGNATIPPGCREF